MKQILIKPVITEKSMSRVSQGNQYTFEVASGVNKFEIKQAIEKEFKVHVLSVRTIIRKGKAKSTGKKRMKGFKTQDRKFAIVKLKEGEKIESFTQ